MYSLSVSHECHYRKTSIGHQGKDLLFFMLIMSSGILIPIRFACQVLEFHSRRRNTDRQHIVAQLSSALSVGSIPQHWCRTADSLLRASLMPRSQLTVSTVLRYMQIQATHKIVMYVKVIQQTST